MDFNQVLKTCVASLTTLVFTSAFAADIAWVSLHSADNTPSTAAATAGFVQAPDVGYTDLLAANGHTVTRFLTSDTPNVALLNTYDLVVVSRSVASGHYELDAETAAWNGITAPMMLLNGYILRSSRLGFTTGTGVPDTTGNVTLTVNNPSHPIFDGIALDLNLRTPAYASQVTWNSTLQRGISINTNAIATGGVVLARVADEGSAAVGGMAIGEWFAGSTMATTPADTLGGHRLVFLTGSREASGLTSEGAGIYDLTPVGSQMFLNSVEYMTVPEPSVAAMLGLAFIALLLRRR